MACSTFEPLRRTRSPPRTIATQLHDRRARRGAGRRRRCQRGPARRLHHIDVVPIRTEAWKAGGYILPEIGKCSLFHGISATRGVFCTVAR
jgi:hypothetical protein